MCEPTTIAAASLALSAVSAGVGFMSQKGQAEAQEQQNAQLTQSAQEAYQNEIEALRQQAQEDRSSTTEEILKNRKDALAASSRAKVSASENSVSGLSLDAMLQDYERQEAEYKSAILENLERRDDQRTAQAASAGTTYQSRLNSQSPISSPSLLQAGLGFASDAVGIYDNYQTQKTAETN